MPPQQNQGIGYLSNAPEPTQVNYNGNTTEGLSEVTGRIPQPDYPKPLNTIRPITIEQLNHGYVVKVGCQTFAIESATHLISKLEAYITNPAKTEQKWQEGVLF